MNKLNAALRRKYQTKNKQGTLRLVWSSSPESEEVLQRRREVREKNRQVVRALEGKLVSLHSPTGEYSGVMKVVCDRAYFYRRHGQGVVSGRYWLEDLQQQEPNTTTFSTDIRAAWTPCQGWEGLETRVSLYIAEQKKAFFG